MSLLAIFCASPLLRVGLHHGGFSALQTWPRLEDDLQTILGHMYKQSLILVEKYVSIPPMKNWSVTNASFKNRPSESVHLKNRSTANLIHCSWSFFETYSFTWLIFETWHFTWSVFLMEGSGCAKLWCENIQPIVAQRIIYEKFIRMKPFFGLILVEWSNRWARIIAY